MTADAATMTRVPQTTPPEAELGRLDSAIAHVGAIATIIFGAARDVTQEVGTLLADAVDRRAVGTRSTRDHS